MRNTLLCCLVGGLIALLVLGCEQKNESAAPQAGAADPNRKVTIALLPKKKGVPYFTSCAQGAEQAAKELGNLELIYDGPSDGSAEKSAGMIERWTLQGVNVIAVSPNDPNVLAPAMKAARDKGVKVITWDADGLPGTRELFVNQATSQEIGFALTDALARDIGGDKPEGEVAVITATLTAANQNAWIDAIKQRLANYPGLKLVEIKPSGEDQKLALQVAQDLMKAYPNLKGIFAISSVAFPGAAEAIKQANQAGKVQVVGLATPNDMKAYVKEGVVKSVILWNTVDLGYLTVRTANILARGQLKPGDARIDGGRLGPVTIKGDNVLLGNILVFTKENIDDYDF